MWNLSKSILLTIIIVIEITHGLVAISVSTNVGRLEKVFNLELRELINKCDNQKEETIHLDKMGLKILRDNFVISDTVKAINLEDNQISEISLNAFKAAPNLSCVNIRRNNLTTMFEDILHSFNGGRLTSLNLADAWFHNSTKDLTHKILSIEDKEIDEISLSILPYLTHLDISNNNLTEIPRHLSITFPFMTHIYLSDNHIRPFFFTRIPKTIQHVYLERNGYDIEVTRLPEDVRGLFFHGNRVYQENNKVGLFPNLRVLSLRKCKNYIKFLRSLDQGKLVDLDLSQNYMFFVPQDLLKNATSLERLSLDRNSLREINFLAPFYFFTDLSFAYNSIYFIKVGTFTKHTNLRSLNLRGNSLDQIYNSTFETLVMLEKLDLSENNLMSLPELWMIDLNSLLFLNLRSNQFPSIESMNIHTDSNLNQLFIENNSFTEIEISSLMGLPATVDVHISSIDRSSCKL